MKKYLKIIVCCLLLASLLACGKANENEYNPDVPDVEVESEEADDTGLPTDDQVNMIAENVLIGNADENNKSETAEERELKERFGENCIASQTFEVELSEYDGKVWFVPFAPSNDQGFHMQIIRDGEILTDIPSVHEAYVPDELEGRGFVSLDAVSFFDVNYDNATDIVLIETYGDTSFAAVYYGVFYDMTESPIVYFYANESISDYLTNEIDELTIPIIRNFLGNGKKNGEYTDYREAYLAVSKLLDVESNGGAAYNLINFDGDDIPELVVDLPGFQISMYTFHNGKIYMLMDNWGYGAGGNHGYEYAPGQNSLRNYNTDYAGLILFTTYMAVSEQYTMDLVVSIQTNNFDDANGNGIPDENEEASFGYYSVSYINGVEVKEEEWAAYDMGEYENIEASMSLEELKSLLSFSG